MDQETREASAELGGAVGMGSARSCVAHGPVRVAARETSAVHDWVPGGGALQQAGRRQILSILKSRLACRDQLWGAPFTSIRGTHTRPSFVPPRGEGITAKEVSQQIKNISMIKVKFNSYPT